MIPVHQYPPRYGAAPRLRQLEVRETTVEGQRLYAARAAGAPEEQSLLLSREALAIAALFDGTRGIRDVQREIHVQYNELLYVERIHELAAALHKAGLFDSGGAVAPDAESAEAVTDPGHRAVRTATHAGSAYAADPAELRAALDGYFTHPEGPGAMPQAANGARVAGIVVPHIDLHRGGPVYAHAYRSLAEGTDADLFVILGTAHASPEPLFTLTRQHYDTPLGPVHTDARALAALEEALGTDIYRAEDAHRDEHSIEFQALFLKYLYGDRPFTILPVLCSTLYPTFSRGARPGDEPELQRFLAALGEAVRGRRVCFIASADLSHVGLLYGDATPPGPRDLEALARRDLDSLALMTAGDREAFFDHVAPDGDSRRICGLTPIYVMLHMTGGSPGRLLRYAQWHGEEHGAAVTYAAATVDAP